MLEKIFKNTETYKKNEGADTEHKKNQGQYFTSLTTVKFMSSYYSPRKRHIRILDPGAGNGILGAAVAKHLVSHHLCSEITITFVENDKLIISLLKSTIKALRKFCDEEQVDCHIKLIKDNFILKEIKGRYDFVICNPPFKKIRKDSEESLAMSEFVHGQPNLYALFMTKGLNLLEKGGCYIYITPRSWTSGAYFQKVRETILSDLAIDKIHIFNSREKSFSDENVLQETMILFGRKTGQANEIKISVSEDDTYNNLSEFEIDAQNIKGIGKDKYLLIPGNVEEAILISEMNSMPETFESLGYIFKTGPVVEFRNADFIRENMTDSCNIPMFRSMNIQNGRFIFPISAGKAQYISADAKNLLLPNNDTVLIKRLSAKEEKKRIQSCVYYKQGSTEFMSIENHVNYVARTDGAPLERQEVEWIHDILSSEEYDIFFRIINGSTQVNASELNKLPVRRIF